MDDDCNGLIDDTDPEDAASCSTGLLGECEPGVLVCNDGLPVCADEQGPEAEQCNGLDDDCDGAVDEEDADQDGVLDCVDDCPEVHDPDQIDTDDDGLGDACDCAIADPSNAPPAEVGNTLRLGHAAGVTTLSWDAEPSLGSYLAYRGQLDPATSWDYNQTCFGAPIPGTSTTDSQDPQPATMFWYLISREACGESILGRDSAGSPVPHTEPCPGVD